MWRSRRETGSTSFHMLILWSRDEYVEVTIPFSLVKWSTVHFYMFVYRFSLYVFEIFHVKIFKEREKRFPAQKFYQWVPQNFQERSSQNHRNSSIEWRGYIAPTHSEVSITFNWNRNSNKSTEKMKISGDSCSWTERQKC